ncbi:MAG: type II toxin-antitoxin system RelE/ParE family toxin [Gammaproteobacteria bacterium]|nr:type II toxin-antitoxin system RelE/ParE family toxin [Gammaproteobacteria bacterium]
MKTIKYSRESLKSLRNMPANTMKRIVGKINQYANDPQSLANNVIRMKGEPHYRLRVGNYRVVFDEFDRIIEIIKVEGRGSVYKKKR